MTLERQVINTCQSIYMNIRKIRRIRPYFSDYAVIHWYVHPPRPLRSAAYPSLVPNKNKTVKFGRRLCDTATAVLWNNLPVHLRCAESVIVFKKKTIKESSVLNSVNQLTVIHVPIIDLLHV